MIAFLHGELYGTTENSAIVECAGVGYEAVMPQTDLEKLNAPGEQVMIHTYLNVNENTGVNLFGFLQKEDLRLFKMLITVSGVGPKVAIAILSMMSSAELCRAIFTDNAKAIAKTPGVGPKLASKVILELKDKIKPEEIVLGAESEEPEKKIDSAETEEAIAGLTALGYARKDAEKAVKKAAKEGMSAEDILDAAFRYL